MAQLSLPESYQRLSTVQLNKHKLPWLLGTEEKKKKMIHYTLPKSSTDLKCSMSSSPVPKFGNIS